MGYRRHYPQGGVLGEKEKKPHRKQGSRALFIQRIRLTFSFLRCT